ncbi:MAG: DNA gyrase inhibitor YacG [Gammaproteobacteria bacterium]
MSTPKVVKCPTCSKPVEWSEQRPWRPFCSERCRLIDLGAWADGSYSVPEQKPGFSEDGTEEN